MKPIQLILQNIGPFVGTTIINFSNLGEMFLICGKTGSGKTTIFDAMTFALYNRLPGNRNSIKSWRLRSDYCPQDANSSVVFDFTLANIEYRVSRNIPVTYTNKNGDLKTKGESASILKKVNGSWIEITNGLKSVELTVKNLIGLEADEFSSIVLLPQGKFAEFLHQGSSKRAELLKKMFPVQRYIDIMNRAKEINNNFTNELKVVESQLTELQKECDTTNFLDNERLFSEQKKEAEDQQAKCKSMLESLKIKKEKAQETAIDIQQYEKLMSQYSEIKQNEKNNLSNITKAQKARLAEKVNPFIEAAKKTKETLNIAQNALESYKTDLQQVKENLSELESQEGEITKIKNEKDKNLILLHDMENAEKIILSLDDAQKRLAIYEQNESSVKKELTQIEEKLQETIAEISSLTPKADLATNLTKETLRLQSGLEKATDMLSKSMMKKQLADEIETKKKYETEITTEEENLQKSLNNAQVILNEFIEEDLKNKELFAASQIASSLKDGENCPVCGSKNHPMVAPKIDSLITMTSKIESQKNLIATAESSLNNTTNRKNRIQGELSRLEEQFIDFSDICSIDECNEKLKEFQTLYDNAKQISEDATKAFAQKKKAEESRITIDYEIKTLREKLNPLSSESSAEKGKVTELKNQLQNFSNLSQLNYNQLKFEKDALLSKIKENDIKIQRYDEKKESLQNEEKTLLIKVEETSTQIETLIIENNHAQSKKEDAISKFSFENEQSVISSLINENELIQIEKNIEKQKEEKQRIEAQLEQAQFRLSSKTKEESENLETIQKKIDEAEIAFSQANTIYTKVIQEQQVFLSQKNKFEELTEKRKKISEEAADYCNLSNDLLGNNNKKISFDVWILGTYLQEVAKYATLRLRQMSDGRYSLKFSQEKSKEEHDSGKNGLELAIFDSFTGKERSCDSLSGGETFMASLSLALAMTDVVQNKSGGIQLESLFIDEGFGSLDEDSLDKSLDLLDEIRGTRIVALISHVDSIKDRIQSRLEITSSPSGSTVKEVIL